MYRSTSHGDSDGPDQHEIGGFYVYVTISPSEILNVKCTYDTDLPSNTLPCKAYPKNTGVFPTDGSLLFTTALHEKPRLVTGAVSMLKAARRLNLVKMSNVKTCTPTCRNIISGVSK